MSSALKLRARLLKALSIGDDILSLSVHIRDIRSPLSMATLAMRGAQTWMKHSTLFMDPLSGYTQVPVHAHIGLSVLQLMRKKKQITEVDGIYEKTFPSGVTVFWEMIDNSNIEGPYVKNEEDEERGTEALCTYFWDHYGSQIFIQGQQQGSMQIITDPLSEKGILTSKKVEGLWADYQKMLGDGGNLSVLLYGPSRSGKTAAARYLSHLAGGRFLRVSVKDIYQLYQGMELIKDLKPSAVCIEDIDRCPETPLEIVEAIRAVCPFMIVTANTLQGLDPALLAPERFDEIEFFDRLEDEIYDKLLANIDADVAEVLRALPVGYVDYYRRTSERLGKDRGREKLEALVNRAETVEKMFAKLEGGANLASRPPEEWDFPRPEEDKSS